MSIFRHSGSKGLSPFKHATLPLSGSIFFDENHEEKVLFMFLEPPFLTKMFPWVYYHLELHMG